MAQLLRRYFVSGVIGGLVLAHMTTLAAAGGNSVKEHICHLTGSGQVIDRLVNERAIPRHLNHVVTSSRTSWTSTSLSFIASFTRRRSQPPSPQGTSPSTTTSGGAVPICLTSRDVRQIAQVRFALIIMTA